ncbi:peptidase domain-containing ABC transporter [soil metagenome]
MSFPFYKQHDAMDCGPTCLKMVAQFYGQSFSLDKLRELCNVTREGVSILGISDAAEAIGFRTIAISVDFEKIKEQAPLPFIAHWKQAHFVVVYKITSKHIYVADPGFNLVKYTVADFLEGWLSHNSDGNKLGVGLLLEPTPKFFEQKDATDNISDPPKRGFRFLFQYLTNYRRLIFQLMIGMVLGSLLQLILPFLTQSIVDFGINHRDISFIYLILVAQLMLFFSRTVVDFVRGWILLHIGQRINISLVSDFLIKLMKMPIAFFDSKMLGDIIQRIGDHNRIEQFLTASTLNVLFSMFNLLIFGVVLGFYSIKIFAVFLVGSILYSIWVVLFMKRRRELDFKRFDKLRQNQDTIIQLISGMQEIKMHNSEKQKRWEWERIQARLYQINMQSLKLNQYQQAGAVFLNEGKNIFITFLAASAVIHGEMTLGMMLSVQYIIGQLNSPIDQLIGFMQSAQDAKISLERLSEIHDKPDEEAQEQSKVHELPVNCNMKLENISFHYPGMQDQFALQDISLLIPEGKVTAIVGSSGSGKSTLIKILLGFYKPQKGSINVGPQSLFNLSNKLWRSKCGVVMQEGFIFSDSIERNIALGAERIDRLKLRKAVEIANISEYIEGLPLGFQTKIGSNGQGISAGQKQRILIARAVYKDPAFIFFDEATNALDANNERTIIEKLDEFFVGRTVVVVAHRLSTVKHADQIVVVENGKIVEVGPHEALAAIKGSYFHLVRNQLELGK